MVMDNGRVFCSEIQHIKGHHTSFKSSLVFSFDLLHENGSKRFEGKCDQAKHMTHNSLQP